MLDHVLALRDRFLAERVPLFGSIELTRDCNLRCCHCYLSRDHGSPGRAELDTGQWLDIIDQITRAGCLNLLITGGEPLTRPDFPVLYERAKTNGLIVTLFTNATLVLPAVADLLADLPPLEVEVSIYGATPGTYDRITGVAGSHARCLEGIRVLLDRKVRVRLKTMLMTLNCGELGEMERMALELGLDFRFDPVIFPRLDGDQSPLKYRLPPEEAARLELADPERARRWRAQYCSSPEPLPGNPLYTCGAGVTHFHIDATGVLFPCALTQEPSCDLLRDPFETGWRSVIPRLHDLEAEPGYSCNSCPERVICGLCPAVFRLETGDPAIRSGYVCQLGRHRRIMIEQGITTGGFDETS